MLRRTSPRPTVHVVDQDAAVRHALAFSLDLEGYDVRTYASSEALLQSAEPLQSGCLVLDENLPGMSCTAALKALRARQVELPAIFLASRARPACRAEAAEAGVSIFEKPLLDGTLVKTIQALLQS